MKHVKDTQSHSGGSVRLGAVVVLEDLSERQKSRRREVQENTILERLKSMWGAVDTMRSVCIYLYSKSNSFFFVLSLHSSG